MLLVKNCINYLKKSEYSHLFDDECINRLNNVKRQYGDMKTNETILEVCLSNDTFSCDYSIRIDAELDFIKEYWLELDFEACEKNPIIPCHFLDAEQVKTNDDLEQMFQVFLPKIADNKTISKVRPMLTKCFEMLRDKNIGIYQIGLMSSRKMIESLRLFTSDMRRLDIIEYLQSLKWNGSLQSLNEMLSELEKYSDKREFIVDFDVFDDHISDKIGINFGTINKNTNTIKKFLVFLQNKNLCIENKKNDVLKFIDEFPQADPYLQNDISHFKLPFINNHVTMAKAYLRQGGELYQHDFRSFISPVIMNLELTTKCPLHCPQCYCDLSRGYDMDKDTALYWINQAAENNIKFVNLSGGETFCYPYLDELITKCNDLGLEANVALSGYNADKNRLNGLIQRGVADICISLNGSTSEINSKSRDGYELAINALKILKELEYKRTCINWVMHSFNADDFENMIALAEFYNVSSLVVMMFKPDISGELKSVPTKNQIFNVAKIIKRYTGKLKIEIEECFSQMRAVVGEKFFYNSNTGISRGCGAGRDGFSVSIDGYLTPCRHLTDFKENYSSIKDYWLNSSTLKKLRSVEDEINKPCIDCKYKKNCLPCAAVIWNFNKKLVMSDNKCPMSEAV